MKIKLLKYNKNILRTVDIWLWYFDVSLDLTIAVERSENKSNKITTNYTIWVIEHSQVEYARSLMTVYREKRRYTEVVHWFRTRALYTGWNGNKRIPYTELQFAYFLGQLIYTYLKPMISIVDNDV